MNSTANLTADRRCARGFTLVEVLVVLVLTSILAGMVMTAVQGVTTSARIAKTRSIVATVDSVVQELYESYKYRPLPVVTPSAGAGALSLELLPTEAARVRLIMTRDLLRMELPDRVSDIRLPTNRGSATPPVIITAAADQVYERADGTLSLRRRDNPNDLTARTQVGVSWYTTTNPPPRFSAYWRRTSPSWTAEHQGAECLYLILATTFSGGVAAIEAIPAANIADTDGDGVPEILDGWGRPLGFVRWPVGLDDTGINTASPDEFDPYRTDFRYLPGVVPVNSTGSRPAPFSIRPLVISAGPDGEFGIAFSPRRSNLVDEDNALSEAALVDEEVNYATHVTQTWPIEANWMGPEISGRTGTYRFPDPYLRHYVEARGNSPFILPGGNLGGDRARSYRADNISNYQLEATQ